MNFYSILFARSLGGGGGGGGQSVERSDVNFYDYDGTVIDSYTASEFAALNAMPNNPSHAGLTAQGWNWSLADAKTYVAKCGKLNIGQMYKTSDGALRLYTRLEEGRLSPVLGLCPNGTLTVDWGDGSATETMTGSSTSTLVYLGHTYAAAGDYVISVTPSSGSGIGFGQSNNSSTILCKSQDDSVNERRVYLNSIYKIEIPDSVTSIRTYAFNYCSNLTSVTIPDSVTSIGANAFYNCYSLTSVTIPDSVTSIGANAFYNCYSLTSVTIPDSVTSIDSSAFRNCSNLTSVTIPDSVTSIDSYVFYNCYSLPNVAIPDSVTSIGSSVFYNCYSLSNVAIPDSVTSIRTYAFYYCSSLTSVTIPDSVTSIGNNTFQNCSSLSAVTIPDSVTSIGGSAFQNCYGLGFIKFTSPTPPTVANVNAWDGIPTDCIIYVPTGYLEDYEDATNFPDPDVYQYVEY